MASMKKVEPSPGLTLTQAIFPTVLLLRIFGLDIAPPANPSALRRFIWLVIYLPILIAFMSFGAMAVKHFSIESNISDFLLNGSVLITNLQLTFILIYFRILLNDFVEFIQSSQKLLSKFEGSEQSFLYWLRILSLLLFFLNLCGNLIGFLGIIFSHKDANYEEQALSKLVLEAYKSEYNLEVLVTCVIIFVNIWYTAIYIILLTAFLVIIFIFKYLSDVEGPLPTAIKCPKPYMNHMVNFIHVHREACEIFRKFDAFFRHILLVMLTKVVCDFLVFIRVAFGKHESREHFSLAVLILIALTCVMILIGTINNLVLTSVKRLSHLRLAIEEKNKLSPNMAWALTAKVELYYDHILLDRPALTAGGLIKMSKGDIIAVLGFLMTYTLYLFNKENI